MIRSTIVRQAAVFGLGWWIALGSWTEARAQQSADPYKPYNAEYDQYLYPSYPNGFGVTPNQTILEMPTPRATSRSFQSYLEEDVFERDGRGAASLAQSRRAPGVPYYRAYRQLDRAYKRVYTPNEDVDRNYDAARRARDEKYSEYLAATDPAERAKLRKQYEQLSRKTRTDLEEGGRGIVSRKATTPARPSAVLPPPTNPPVRGTPANTAPAAAPTTGRTAPRPNPQPAATGGRSPSEILKRSESLDRRTTPPLPEPPSPARRIERSDPPR